MHARSRRLLEPLDERFARGEKRDRRTKRLGQRPDRDHSLTGCSAPAQGSTSTAAIWHPSRWLCAEQTDALAVIDDEQVARPRSEALQSAQGIDPTARETDRVTHDRVFAVRLELPLQLGHAPKRADSDAPEPSVLETPATHRVRAGVDVDVANTIRERGVEIGDHVQRRRSQRRAWKPQELREPAFQRAMTITEHGRSPGRQGGPRRE